MDFDPFSCVCVFQGSLLVIEAAKNAIVKAAFELKSSHVSEKRSNTTFETKFCKAPCLNRISIGTAVT